MVSLIMKFAIYRGSVVEVGEDKGTIICIKDDLEIMFVEKDALVIIQDGAAAELLQELAPIKNKIADITARMYRLETEYRSKMESLRGIYLEIRSKELGLVNRILKNSQGNCQK